MQCSTVTTNVQPARCVSAANIDDWSFAIASGSRACDVNNANFTMGMAHPGVSFCTR